MAIDNRNKRRARVAACSGALVATVFAVATTHAQVTQLDPSVMQAFPNVRIVNVTPAQQPAVATATGETGAGLRAFIDPATGRLTENPTEAHLRDLESGGVRGARPGAKIGSTPTTFRRGNAVGAQLDDTFLLHAVVRRDVDGDLDMSCVVGDHEMTDFLAGYGQAAPHSHAHGASKAPAKMEVK